MASHMWLPFNGRRRIFSRRSPRSPSDCSHTSWGLKYGRAKALVAAMMHSAQLNLRTMATVSSRNASASSAARSAPSSGTRRVLTEPGSGNLAKMEIMASCINVFDQNIGYARAAGGNCTRICRLRATGVRPHFFPQRPLGDAAQPPYQYNHRGQAAPEKDQPANSGVGPSRQKMGDVPHDRAQINRKDAVD